MVSYSAQLDRRTKQHTQFGVSVSNGSKHMARTKVAEKKKKKEKKKEKKMNMAKLYANNDNDNNDNSNNNSNCNNNETGSRSPCMRPRSDPPNFGPIMKRVGW